MNILKFDKYFSNGGVEINKKLIVITDNVETIEEYELGQEIFLKLITVSGRVILINPCDICCHESITPSNGITNKFSDVMKKYFG